MKSAEAGGREDLKEGKMPEPFSGFAETACRLYFLSVLGWVKDLHQARRAIAETFLRLLREFSEALPHSGLFLYPRFKPSGESMALYWGRFHSRYIRTPGSKASAFRTVVQHLAGPFQKDWVFTIARRYDRRDRYLDFDRRRLALNHAFQAVAKATAKLVCHLKRRFRAEIDSQAILPRMAGGGLRPVPEFPDGILPSDLPAALRQGLRAAWVGVYSLALAEEEASRIALEMNEDPMGGDLRLEVSDRKEDSWMRSLQWRHVTTGGLYPKLTYPILRKLRIRKVVRPILKLKDRSRRRIEKALHWAASAFDGLRAACQAAQKAATSGLIEAQTIIFQPQSKIG